MSGCGGGDLLVNQRPSRAIKRRRFSEDTYEEVPNMEAVFKSREVLNSSSPSKSEAVAAAALDVDVDGVSVSVSPSLTLTTTPFVAASVNVAAASGKRLKSSSKRLKNRAQFMNTIWRAEDDLLLIDAVIQTNDLLAVFASVRFSTHFTLKEVQERWESLLFDLNISKFAQERILKLPIDIRRRILRKAVFSEPEEQILCDINSNNLPSLENFQNALSKHRNVFHVARTAKCLRKHWLLLRRYRLLSNQGVNNQLSQESFAEVEERLSEKTSEVVNKAEMNDPVIQNEICLAGMRAHEEIKVLETELPRWQFLLSHTTGNKLNDFDEDTYAVLRGRSIRFLMQSRSISLGRCCKDNKVDVDLSLEGPAHKISRVQALISLLPSGAFVFHNQGKRPVFVDGRAVLPGNKKRLMDNSVIIICKVALLFLVNGTMLSHLRHSFNAQIVQSTRTRTTAHVVSSAPNANTAATGMVAADSAIANTQCANVTS